MVSYVGVDSGITCRLEMWYEGTRGNEATASCRNEFGAVVMPLVPGRS